jgi:thioredoxin-like negative regulator of GroEL
MQRALSSLTRSGLRKSAKIIDHHLQHSIPIDLPSSSRLSTTTPSPPTHTSSPTHTSPPTSFLEITDAQSFNSVVSLSNTGIPVILQASAAWCGPCKQLEPVLKQQITAQNGKIALAKLDIDLPAVAPLVQQLQITSVPTLILLLGGRAVDIKQGAPSPPELKEWITKAIELAEAVKKAAVGGETEQQGEENIDDGVSAPPAKDPKLLIEEAFSEARSPEGRASIEKLAPKFAAALNHPTADVVIKAEATAGLALCAILDGDLSTAKELLSNAKAAANQAQQQAPNLPPLESSVDSEIMAVEAT